MDAEHRHELKSNELANWISNIPDWLKKNSNLVIGAALILIGLITWPLLSNMAKEKDVSQQAETTNSIQMLENDVIKAVTQKTEDPQARQQALSMLLVNADALLEKADELDNPNLAALSRIKAAQTIRTELQLRREDVSAQTVEEQIKKAKDAYEKAYNQAKTAQIKGLAQLGLGLCAEELGQTDEAKGIYNEIIKNEDYAATVVPAQAKSRLDVLDSGIGNVYFAPAPLQPEAAEMPAQAPAEAPVIETPVQAPAAQTPAQQQEADEKAEAVVIPADPQAVEKAPAQVPAETPQPAPAEQKPNTNE